MLRATEPYNLLKAYRQAHKRADLMLDIDDKVLAYNNIINYCTSRSECRNDESIKHHQILFWTYNNIGDMFMIKNAKHPNRQNYLQALQYYHDSLSFAHTASEKRATLEKIAHIYTEMHDETGRRKILEQIAISEENCMKRQAFTELAKQTDDIKLQAKYLEYALTFVMAENISVLEKGENILKICARLLHIYKHTKSGKHYRRIKELEQNTRELLQ